MAKFLMRATQEFDAEIEADTEEEAIAEMRFAALENGQISATSSTVEVIG